MPLHSKTSFIDCLAEICTFMVIPTASCIWSFTKVIIYNILVNIQITFHKVITFFCFLRAIKIFLFLKNNKKLHRFKSALMGKHWAQQLGQTLGCLHPEPEGLFLHLYPDGLCSQFHFWCLHLELQGLCSSPSSAPVSCYHAPLGLMGDGSRGCETPS